MARTSDHGSSLAVALDRRTPHPAQLEPLVVLEASSARRLSTRTRPGREVEVSREAMLTTGPSTSPSRETVGPQAETDTQLGEVLVARPLLDQLETDDCELGRLVGHEEHLITDRLDDPPTVRREDLECTGLEALDEHGQPDRESDLLVRV